MPTAEERAAIWKVQLAKYKQLVTCNFKKGIPNSLLELTDGFTGSEIEQVIIGAMTAAFDDDGRELEFEDLMTAIKEARPLSKVAADKIQALRAWAKDKAVSASLQAAVDVELGHGHRELAAGRGK